jgi:hypothetical protein
LLWLLGSLTKYLVAIWMAMAPIPVMCLLAATIVMELAIVSVPFAEVDPIGTVFAVIPLMVVTMIAIVVARVIAPRGDNHFLRSARPGCCRGSERRREKDKTQIFGCWVHVILRKARTPMKVFWLAASMHTGTLGSCSIQDTMNAVGQVEDSFVLKIAGGNDMCTVARESVTTLEEVLAETDRANRLPWTRTKRQTLTPGQDSLGPHQRFRLVGVGLSNFCCLLVQHFPQRQGTQDRSS